LCRMSLTQGNDPPPHLDLDPCRGCSTRRGALRAKRPIFRAECTGNRGKRLQTAKLLRQCNRRENYSCYPATASPVVCEVVRDVDGSKSVRSENVVLFECAALARPCCRIAPFGIGYDRRPRQRRAAPSSRTV